MVLLLRTVVQRECNKIDSAMFSKYLEEKNNRVPVLIY